MFAHGQDRLPTGELKSCVIAGDMVDDDSWENAGIDPNLLVVSPESYEECLGKILEVFPDISHEYVRETWTKESAVVAAEGNLLRTSQHLIEVLLEGGKYPKERDRQRELKLKRKREADEEETQEIARRKQRRVPQ